MVINTSRCLQSRLRCCTRSPCEDETPPPLLLGYPDRFHPQRCSSSKTILFTFPRVSPPFLPFLALLFHGRAFWDQNSPILCYPCFYTFRTIVKSGVLKSRSYWCPCSSLSLRDREFASQGSASKRQLRSRFCHCSDSYVVNLAFRITLILCFSLQAAIKSIFQFQNCALSSNTILSNAELGAPNMASCTTGSISTVSVNGFLFPALWSFCSSVQSEPSSYPCSFWHWFCFSFCCWLSC